MEITYKQAKWFYFLILPTITITSIISRVFLVAWFSIFGAIALGLTISGE